MLAGQISATHTACMHPWKSSSVGGICSTQIVWVNTEYGADSPGECWSVNIRMGRNTRQCLLHFSQNIPAHSDLPFLLTWFFIKVFSSNGSRDEEASSLKSPTSVISIILAGHWFHLWFLAPAFYLGSEICRIKGFCLQPQLFFFSFWLHSEYTMGDSGHPWKEWSFFGDYSRKKNFIYQRPGTQKVGRQGLACWTKMTKVEGG